MPSFIRYEEEHYYLDPRSTENLNSDNKCQKKLFPSLFDPETIYLSVIIPAKDEEQRLPLMLDECLGFLESKYRQNNAFTWEVLIVDDGSTDGTTRVGLEYARKYSTEKIRVLTLRHNRGKGGAVRLGMMSARGRYLLMADADGATRFSDFDKLEAEIIANSGDKTAVDCAEKVVANSGDSVLVHEDFERDGEKVGLGVAVGSRAHLEKESVAKRSIFRSVLMWGFHLLVWIFGVRSIKDTQCGFKLFTRPTARLLFSNLHVERWAFDVELLYLAEQMDIPIGEVAVNWHEVEGSKITPVWSWIQMGKDLVLIWLWYFIGVWKIESRQKQD